jgi:hypothetical protein
MWFPVDFITRDSCWQAPMRGKFEGGDSDHTMRWFKPNLRNSIYGLLGHSPAPSESKLECGMEDIREAMLGLLGEDGAKKFPAVTRRIRYAADIQALWYLRGDLMAALATVHGESTARAKVREITEMFQGLLPGSLTSRPSPLMG